MPKSITIGKHRIGEGEPTYIVAEIGINHNGDIDHAKKMVEAAQLCGADAVKFQVFKANEFVSDERSTYTYVSQGKQITESMLNMFRRYEFSEEEWRELFRHCRQRSVEFFITPQNPSDLDFILAFEDIPAIKVGSDDLTNLELLENYAERLKPIIISSGMAYLSEIEEAVRAIRNMDNNDIIILHCVSSYPASAEEIHLRKIPTIQRAFNVHVGFSDHTVGSTAAVGAVVMGAAIVEKHFTLDKSLPGPDHWFSAHPEEFQSLVRDVRYIERTLGTPVVEPTEREIKMRHLAHRSIVASRHIKQGDVISREMFHYGRPGTGLPPKFAQYILQKTAKRSIAKNEQITFDDIC